MENDIRPGDFRPSSLPGVFVSNRNYGIAGRGPALKICGGVAMQFRWLRKKVDLDLRPKQLQVARANQTLAAIVAFTAQDRNFRGPGRGPADKFAASIRHARPSG